MITFNVGDRVHVEFDGIVAGHNAEQVMFEHGDFSSEDFIRSYVPIEFCTKLKLVPPLKVGQEIGADSEEPPIGTLLVWDAEGVKRTASRGLVPLSVITAEVSRG